MRRDDAVFRGQQRVIRTDRLLADHVQPGGKNLSAVERVGQALAPFDAVLKGAQLLDAEAHPQAWFVARRAEFDGDAPRRVHGEITLRGQSAPLTLTATRWRCGLNLLFRREVCGGDFEARLSRAAFGMTLAAGLVADEVRLLIQVEAVRADAPATAPVPPASAPQ